MLSVDEVARHYGFRPDTVRRKIRTGELGAVRIRRAYRLDWDDVWACEKGPLPKGAQIARYQERLLAKKEIAGALAVSVRTVGRWIEGGMPTRCVFGAVRCNPDDVADWLRQAMDVHLPGHWWKE